MKRSFQRSTASLESVFKFVKTFFETEAIAESHRYAVDLALEEIFTNHVKYHPEGAGEIAISLDATDGNLMIRIFDHDVDRYDITRAAEVDIEKPLEERRPGGLGLHLIRKMMDRVEYAYENRSSTITLVKQIGTPDV